MPLDTAAVVPEESETATAPARTNVKANALITVFIVRNLNHRNMA
jgi:hypothetical protein